MKRLAVVAALAALSCGGGGQSAECKKYLACSEALSPGSTASLGATYGSSGICWTTSASEASTCTNTCTSLTNLLRNSSPNTAECK
jgi:hypothetical protein